MRVFGITHQNCGLGIYANILSEMLGTKTEDIFRVLCGGIAPSDSILVMGANGPFCFDGEKVIIPFWEYHGNINLSPINNRFIAPSRFVSSCVCIERSLPILVKPELYSVPNKDFTILYVFDSKSDIVRKNPFLLCNAVKSMHNPPRLIIKTNMPRPPGVDSKIEWINGWLNEDEYDRLWERCSVYVSPSRGEGLGMTVLEAMGRGKPIVAVGYGAHTEFCGVDHSIMLPYSFSVVKSDHPSYSGYNSPIPGASIDDLVYALEMLRGDPSKVENMSIAGRKRHSALVKMSDSIPEILEAL